MFVCLVEDYTHSFLNLQNDVFTFLAPSNTRRYAENKKEINKRKKKRKYLSSLCASWKSRQR